MIKKVKLEQGESSGKCGNCEVRYIWKYKPRVSEAYCPKCKAKLFLTTWQLRYKVSRRKILTGKRLSNNEFWEGKKWEKFEEIQL